MINTYNLKQEKIKISLIYAVFGTVGVVAHFIPLASSAIVFYRAVLGALFITISTYLRGQIIDFKSIITNFKVLIFTGFFMGLNWVLQFEAFRVSSVAIGTVCYNTMPIFLVLIASIVFKEKISMKSAICIFVAMIGIVLVSNVIYTGISSNEVVGSIYGLLGAIFYALILISNRYLSKIETRDKVVFQFIFSAFVMLIYVLFISKGSLLFYGDDKNKNIVGLVCLILLGVFHTGFCYIHYFDSVSRLKAETVAILTYIDPVVALFLSFFVLREKMTVLQLIGAILIFASTIANEFIKFDNKRTTKTQI